MWHPDKVNQRNQKAIDEERDDDIVSDEEMNRMFTRVQRANDVLLDADMR